jgi:phosphonate transport system substrate-binding protein
MTFVIRTAIATASLLGIIFNTQSLNRAIAQPLNLSKSQVVAQAPTPITVIFANRRDSTDLQNKANQVAAILSKEMGMPVTAVIADETAAVEALRGNRANVVFLASRAALKAESLASARMYLAEVRPEYSGGKTYRSIFVVKKDSPLKTFPSGTQTLEQLRGKTMAFTSRTSGSGFIFPVSELVGRKLVENSDRVETFFGKVNYGDGYSSALQAVLRGQADVGVVSEYALLPPYVTTDEAKQLRVLYSVADVPAHGIVIDDSVPVETREKLIAAFMKMNEPANNGLFRSLYNSTNLVQVDHDRHLATAREAIKRAGLQP